MNSAAPIFATTHWSVVLAAGQSAEARASEALEQLCRHRQFSIVFASVFQGVQLNFCA